MRGPHVRWCGRGRGDPAPYPIGDLVRLKTGAPGGWPFPARRAVGGRDGGWPVTGGAGGDARAAARRVPAGSKAELPPGDARVPPGASRPGERFTSRRPTTHALNRPGLTLWADLGAYRACSSTQSRPDGLWPPLPGRATGGLQDRPRGIRTLSELRDPAANLVRALRARSRLTRICGNHAKFANFSHRLVSVPLPDVTPVAMAEFLIRLLWVAEPTAVDLDGNQVPLCWTDYGAFPITQNGLLAIPKRIPVLRIAMEEA